MPQQREREAAGTPWQESGHAFTTAQGKAIYPPNLTRVFTTLLRMAGLRLIRFHNLRHSTAPLLLEGVELVVIKELLGNTLSRADDGIDDPPTAAVVR